MASVIPPTHEAWTFAGGEVCPPDAKGFWASLGGQPRGKTFIREAGTWSVVITPTTGRINAADDIVNPDGITVKAVLQGGHVTPVTAAVAAELTSAGFGAYLV